MTLPADAHVGTVSLTVADLDRSVPFYRDILGFQEITRAGRTSVLSAGGDRALIELHERRDAVPRPRRSTGLFHFAILVPSRAALGRSLRRLADRQWPLTGVADRHLGMNTWAGVGAPPPPENAVGLRSFSIEGRGLDRRDVDDVGARVVVTLVGG